MGKSAKLVYLILALLVLFSGLALAAFAVVDASSPAAAREHGLVSQAVQDAQPAYAVAGHCDMVSCGGLGRLNP